MKRLRTLSISDFDSLARKLRTSAWGQSFWDRRLNRKMRERMEREQRIGMALLHAAMHAGAIAVGGTPYDEDASFTDRLKEPPVIH